MEKGEIEIQQEQEITVEDFPVVELEAIKNGLTKEIAELLTPPQKIQEYIIASTAYQRVDSILRQKLESESEEYK